MTAKPCNGIFGILGEVLIVISAPSVSAPCEFVDLNVVLFIPASVLSGVPFTTPVDPFSISPSGKFVTENDADGYVSAVVDTVKLLIAVSATKVILATSIIIGIVLIVILKSSVSIPATFVET